MTNYAKITENHSFLFTDFGLDFAKRKFPLEVIDAIPTFKRGKHIGKPKAVIVWRKVTQGGWHNSDFGGYVESRVGQIIECHLYGLAPFNSGLPYQGKIATANMESTNDKA